MDKKKPLQPKAETPADASRKPAPEPRPVKKHAGGRPSKLTPKVVENIFLLCHKGFTDKEIAQVIGIDEATLNRWKKSPEFCKPLKEAKSLFDAEIEMSLAQRARGFRDPDGHYHAPDVTACIFWLKNRKPAEWRDRIPELSNIADALGSVLQQIRKHREEKAKSPEKKG